MKPIKTLTAAFLTVTTVNLIIGCARFSTTQTDVSYENGKPLRTITTHAAATTLFEGRSSLANFKASQTDKTQGANVGALSQDSSTTTNTAASLNAIVELVKQLKQ